MSIWDNIPLSKQVEAYEILANQYMVDTGELLPRPPGMMGEDTEPLVINAQDYQEMEEIKAEREMKKAPSHQKRIE